MDIKEVAITIKSGVAGIHIQTNDFLRTENDIKLVAKELNFDVKEWTMGYGWVESKSKRPLVVEKIGNLCEDIEFVIEGNPENKLFIINTADLALKDNLLAIARLQHKLLHIKRYFAKKSTIILVSNQKLAIPQLQSLVVCFSCKPLNTDSIAALFKDYQNKNNISIDTHAKKQLFSACAGLEQDTILQIFEKIHNKYGKYLREEAVIEAQEFKKQLLSQTGLLEFINVPSKGIESIGGLDHLKQWLSEKSYIINNLSEAKDLGLPAPKGVLLAGLPGCGKSLTAKVTASIFGIPLLRMDIGSLMGKYVGESEENMRKALNVAEKASPCVLWLDEIEKAFSGLNGAGGGNSETSTRLLGYFLTWLQEKKSMVFVVATANDLTNLPPELLRRGRFDEIFYLDLPNLDERKKIFEALMLEKNSRSTQQLDFTILAKKTKGYSGADIDALLNYSLECLLRRNECYLTEKVIESNLKKVVPISKTLQDKIANYQEMFKKYSLKPASVKEGEKRYIYRNISSSDPVVRQEGASSILAKESDLIKLANDPDSLVRKTVLLNDKCPTVVLEDVISKYQPFDFSKPGNWSAQKLSKDEYNLAIRHKRLSQLNVYDLYKKNKIDVEVLLKHKEGLTKSQYSEIFKNIKLVVPPKYTEIIIRNILINIDDIIHENDLLLEFDNVLNEVHNSHGLVCPIGITIGIITSIWVSHKQEVHNGQKLISIDVPRKKESISL